MKILLNVLLLTALASTTAYAETKVKSGPRKGLILELPGKNAEFFVEQDRTISIAIYDESMQAQAPGTEVITATAEAPSGKAQMTFEKKGDLLVSTTSLPEGESYQVVVQAKSSPEAKPKNFRIKLELYICGPCDNPEYACTCDE